MTKGNTDVISIRVDSGIQEIITTLSNKNSMSINQLIEIMILDSLCDKVDAKTMKLKISGLDVDKYIISCKNAKLREYEGKIRNDIISKATFFNRFRYDLKKLIFFDTDIKTMNDFLESRLREAHSYDNSDELVALISKYQNATKQKIEKWKHEFDFSYYDKKKMISGVVEKYEKKNT